MSPTYQSTAFATLGYSLALFAMIGAQSSAPPSGGNTAPITYTVTSSDYVTLHTDGGVNTYCQYAISVTNGQGGGASQKAEACGVDVSECVGGTVAGTSGNILVKISKRCEKAMSSCQQDILVTLRNGDVVRVPIPYFPHMAKVNISGQETIPPGINLFTVETCSPSYVSVPNGPDTVPYKWNGDVSVDLVTSGTGPAATLLMGGTHGTIQLSTQPSIFSSARQDAGVGHILLDTRLVLPGSTVTMTLHGAGLGPSIATITVQ